jgi:hypothetical protein
MDVSPQSHALPVVEGVTHWLSDMAGQSRLPSLGAPELSRKTCIDNNGKGLTYVANIESRIKRIRGSKSAHFNLRDESTKEMTVCNLTIIFLCISCLSMIETKIYIFSWSRGVH